MLIKSVVQGYKGRARFVTEDYGGSALAKRYGVTRYPVVFVDDVLVVQPKDFGGWNDKGGRYAPFGEPASQDRFKADLARAIDRALRGDAAPSADAAAGSGEIARRPSLSFVDATGHAVGPADLDGKVVVVEFWATWCPPCRTTLKWLAGLERRFPGRVAVIAIALDSPEAEMLKVAKTMQPPAYVVAATPELVRPFGEISATPTLFVFDTRGDTAKVFYGAPPDLHARAGKVIDALVARAAPE